MNNPTTDTLSGQRTVETLQKQWILAWDKSPDEELGSFTEVLGKFYDLDADVILFDDFDPQRRSFRSAQAYGDAFWPTFQGFHSAQHGFEHEPEALVAGDLAATRMVFIAILDNGTSPVVANRCINSQVWRHTDSLGWRIARDHTSVEPMDLDEARRLVALSA